MYVVTDDDVRLTRQAALPEHLRTFVAAGDLPELLLLGIVGAVVVDSSALTPELRAQLERIKAARGVLPLIELVPAIPAAEKRERWADGLVTYGQAHLELSRTVRAASIRLVLPAASAALRATLQPVKRAALALCAVPEHVPPFINVDAVVWFASCGTTTMYRCWDSWSSRSVDGRARLALRQYVDWPLLLRGVAAKQGEDNLDHAATRVGTTRARLDALAYELCDRSLTGLEREHPLLATEVFEAEVPHRLGADVGWGRMT